MDRTALEFLAAYPPPVRDLGLAARALVLEVMPGAHERLNAGHKVVSYGVGPRMADEVLYIAPLVDRVNLGLMRGTELPDPAGLLEGTGKLLRHVKVRSVTDLERPELRALLTAAVAAGGRP